MKALHRERACCFVHVEKLVNLGYPEDCVVSTESFAGSVLNVGDEVSLTVVLANGTLQGIGPQLVCTMGQAPPLHVGGSAVLVAADVAPIGPAAAVACLGRCGGYGAGPAGLRRAGGDIRSR